VKPAARLLIVNADDFGQSPGINRGIIRAWEQGIVTSASLMVRWPAAKDAATYARMRGLDLGLHIDLGEWRLSDGDWIPVYEVVSINDPNAVMAEVSAQLETFISLAGAPPSHLDSHQHVHRKPAIKPFVEKVAERFGIPVRHLDPRVRYRGEFYGQDEDGSPLSDRISVESIIRIIRQLPPGMTELCCHPGEESDDLHTMYRTERRMELEVLCDPRVRQSITDAGIQLTSFSAVGPRGATARG
jgi:predicted glycoside hydrolase/deacetylase ChbG (UPF0249 family)